MKLDLLWHHKTLFLQGAFTSLQISLGATGLGLILGVITGIGRTSTHRLAQVIASFYVYIIRGTPMLLQIFLFFFGIPQLYHFITGQYFSPSPVLIGILALGNNSGAYVGEIVRAGIESLDKGQIEAAQALGFNHAQTMRYIILPQAMRRILPPLGNEMTVLLKDSSLVSAIGASEIMYSAKVLGAHYYSYLEFLLGASFLYLCLTFILGRAERLLERKLHIDRYPRAL